jgi:predicted NBD/HSP70 family sugar kinase
VIKILPNIQGAKGTPLKAMVERSLKLPVFVDNDVSCFTLAEARQGTGRGHDIVVGVTLGTGVGGGIVMHGKVFHGSHGFAAEFGHMLLRPGEPPFKTKDMRGDIEQFISGTAMGRRCPEANIPADYLTGNTCAALHPHIIEEVAWMCASLTHCIDPSIIVIGGAAGRALKPHLKKVEKELKRWVYPGTPVPLLKIAKFLDAGTRGAALLTQESL